jgi:hypothetical protein
MDHGKTLPHQEENFEEDWDWSRWTEWDHHLLVTLLTETVQSMTPLVDEPSKSSSRIIPRGTQPPR